MNFRLTAILFAAVLVLVAGLLAVLLLDDKTDTVADAGLMEPLAKAGVKEKNVDTIELVRTEPAEEKVKFVRVGDGKWEMAEPFAGKADSFAVQALVGDLFRAKPVKYAELTDNLSLHGLDKPTVRVTLKSEGKTETVNVGLTTIGGDTAVTFVTTSSNPKRPLAVRRSDLAGLFRESARGKDGPAWALAKWLADYRPRKLLAADARDPMTELQEVKIKAGGKEVELKRGPAGAWVFANPKDWGEADDLGDSAPQPATAPFTGVRPLLNALNSLQAGPEDYMERPADLVQYGLKPGDPGIVTVEVKGKSGPPEVLLFGKPVEQKKDQPPGMPQVYAQLEGDSAVIKVVTDRVEAIRQTAVNPGELRNKDLLNPTRRDRIDAIDLTVGATTVKLRRVAAGGEPVPRWVLYGGPGDPQDARQTEVAMLLGALTRPRAAREVLTAPNDPAFADPEKKATVKVWLDGIEKPEKAPDPGKLPPEPKLKGVPVELLFGKKEADAVFVRRTTEAGKADLKLPEPALAMVTKTRLEFLDPKVKSFDTLAANRLAFNRGAEPFELTKAAGSTGWSFEKPDARKGKPADEGKVSNLLGLLASLYVDRVVLEQPTPDDLKRLGLDPAAPRMKVTVSLLDPADKERVYFFGTETEDKKWVHATQAGRPLVFLVAKTTVDKLLTEDLRDPTLFKVDTATVKRLKIRGWKGLLTQEPLVLQFEKQAAGWVGVPPTQPGYQPDPAKVSALLAALAAPRAEAFVDVGAKPHHGLDVAQNPDGLEFTIEPEKGPGVTLVLGAKADGGKVYGASSAAPNDVFTIDPAAIRRLLDKPASLQK